MVTLDQIRKDRKKAFKRKTNSQAQAIRYSILTTLLGEAEGIDKSKQKLDLLALIKKFIKNIDESQAVKYSDTTMIEKTWLEFYLPQQLTKEDIRCIFDDNDNSIVDVPSAMKWLKTNKAGQYDGKLASTTARTYFTN